MTLKVLRTKELHRPFLNADIEYRATESPRLTQFQNVLSLPVGGSLYSGGWGLFDSELNAISDSICLTGKDERPYRQVDKLPKPARSAGYLPGTYYYLGPVHTQFGHFLIESMARVWGYKGLNEGGLKIVYHGDLDPDPLFEKHPFIQDIFSGLEINSDSLMRIKEPTILERVYVAQAAIQARNFAYPAFLPMFQEIQDRVLANKPAVKTNQPLYFSKSQLTSGITKIVNDRVMDEIFSSYGAKVVFPEQIPFRDQVRLINSHQTIVGQVGSAFHLLLFKEHEASSFYIVPESQGVNASYPLIDLARGDTGTYCFTGSRTVSHTNYMFPTEILDPAETATEICRIMGLR